LPKLGPNSNVAVNSYDQRVTEFGNRPTVAPIANLSLVFSITFPVVGMVLGLIAKNEIEKAHGEKEGRGLAVSAVIISSIQISLILIGAIVYALWLGPKSINLGGN